MPDSVVMVDFGASRIKSVHYSITQKRIIRRVEHTAPVLQRGPHGEAEGKPELYWQALEATAGSLIAQAPDIQDLWLCAEMHGFLLADQRTSEPVTGYISWQDQRACYATDEAVSTLEQLAQFGPKLLTTSGMRLRSGLPIVNLAAIRKTHWPADRIRFLTLVDWLLLRGGETAPRCNPTLAAGTGLYALKNQDWSPDMLVAIGINPLQMQMPVVGNLASPIGSIQLQGRQVRVWGGLGDLPCAAHGLDFPTAAPILVNLGTGSQVMAIAPTANEDIEIRPCAQGLHAHAITHIPSGRALHTYAAFIDRIAEQSGGSALFWRLFSELHADQVLTAEACIDLNVFSAAWHFQQGGSIGHVIEGRFHLPWLMHSLTKSWLLQYADALNAICPTHSADAFLLGGGLSRRGAFIPRVLETLLGKRAIEPPLLTGEETLDGLLKLVQSSH